MDKWVGQHYGTTTGNKPRTSDYLTVKALPVPMSADKLSETQKMKTKMLPLLFYWK